jgi:4-carboxymuconolactone decarboxylase
VSDLPADVDPRSRNRLPLLERDDLDAPARRFYDANGGFKGPGRIRLYNAPAAMRLKELNDVIRFDSGLDPRLAELAILLVAREMASPYEWYQHEEPALRAGVERELVELVRSGAPTNGLALADAAMVDLVRELVCVRKLSPATFARARDAFGDALLVSYVLLIADYVATATVLAAFDQQLPEGSALPFTNEEHR